MNEREAVVEGGANIPPTALVLVAAGAGTRMHAGTRKAYLELAGKPVLLRTLEQFRDLSFVHERIVVVAPEDVDDVPARWPEMLRELRVDVVVAGGAERVHSVERGLAAVGRFAPNVALVAVHDAARPLVTEECVVDACRAAADIGGAVLGHLVHDTLKREAAAGGVTQSAPRRIAETVSRVGLWAAQTPQVFRVPLLREAYAAWKQAGEPPLTDDASLLERLGCDVALIPSPRTNLKITTPDDLHLAEALLQTLRRAPDRM